MSLATTSIFVAVDRPASLLSRIRTWLARPRSARAQALDLARQNQMPEHLMRDMGLIDDGQIDKTLPVVLHGRIQPAHLLFH